MAAPRRASDALTRAVVEALEMSPLSLLRLSKRSGIPQSSLWRIREGSLRATVATAEAVATALEEFGATCGDAAKRIRRAQQAAHKRMAR